MFHKLGESIALTPTSLQSHESVIYNDEANKRFEKLASELKKISPKSKDFLYFSTAMMTSAESVLYNEDGSAKNGSDGKPLTAHWEPKGESVKWVCSDTNLHPYKNNNGDIFPEAELVKAHKLWIGRPLCKDHRSSSVDSVLGIILDTYYDYKSKKVIALCALDAVNYPDLARKVSTGYASNVSMGTVVRKAICYACGQVARSERDFCQHMKNKTSSEINTELEPIELSLVTNPADVSAKIRTIFASTQEIKSRVYSADLQEKIAQMQQNLNEISNDLSDLNGISKEEEPQTTESNAPVYADINALFTELKILKSSMEQTLEDLNKKQEDIMTDQKNSFGKKAYYQGGGGVNEPEPGKVKYDIDPLQDQLREKGDRHMLQTKEYGGEGDDAIKSEVRPLGERSERRKEALERAKKNLDKRGYWQGGGGVNEPEPGKVKYDIDPLAAQVREKGDKQMVGSKPFPGVGDVDGLYGDDLAVKEKLSRASLTARFIRKANVDGTDDLGNSGWQVFAKDSSGQKLIFTASVNDISANQSVQLFDMIATKEFGGKMLSKIREVGLEKAASVYKRSQDMGAAPPPGAATPVAPMSPPSSDLGAAVDVDADAGGKGDPGESAVALAETTRDNASELLEAVREMTGSQAEMGELEDGIKALPKAASTLLVPAAQMRRKLEKMLVSAAKKSLAELKTHYSELKLISDMAGPETVKNASLNSMIKTAFEEASTVNMTAEQVLRSYSKYASGVENLLTRLKLAQEEVELSANDGDLGDFDLGDFEEESEPLDDATVMPRDGVKVFDDSKDPAFGEIDELEGLDDLEVNEEGEGDDFMTDLDKNEVADGEFVQLTDKNAPPPSGTTPVSKDISDLLKSTPTTPGPVSPGTVPPKSASTDLTTKAGRSAYRAKLAEHITDSVSAESLKFNPLMDEANKLADGQTELDVKPSDDLGYVETKPEVNKRMLEVARATPKTKKEAERLNGMINSGLIKKADLDKLVSEGLDSEVVKYWRDLYGQVDGGSEFAKLLTSAAEKAKMEAEMETYKVKLARSYELANEMARNGLITNERGAIGRQVEESMLWNDEAFDSYKRVTAKMAKGLPTKTAGFVPQVGIRETGESFSGSDDLQTELDLAFSGRKY